MQLIFSEVFHKSELCTLNNDRFHVPGVYIWGFIYEKDGDKIGDPVNFSSIGSPIADPKKHVFIPYYVGKHERSILERLNEHKNFQIGNARKYTRFTLRYMKSFFKDPNFSLNTNNNNALNFERLLNNYSNSHVVEYFNSGKILKMIYGNTVSIPTNAKNDNPINGIHFVNGQPLFDTLSFLGDAFNNFFFSYFESQAIKNLTLFESISALLLKGKTVSKIEKLKYSLLSIQNNNYDLIGPKGFNIFKQPDAIRLDLNRPFELGNIAFPGYL